MSIWLMRVVERRQVPNDSPTGFYREEVLECGHIVTCYGNAVVQKRRTCHECRRAERASNVTNSATSPEVKDEP